MAKFKIGILSRNPQKIEAVTSCVALFRKMFSLAESVPISVFPIMPDNYVPKLEQPIGHSDNENCLKHRFMNRDKLQSRRCHIIIGLESGIHINIQERILTEITTTALFATHTISHGQNSDKVIEHYRESAPIKDLNVWKVIENYWRENVNKTRTLGSVFNQAFGWSSNNWHNNVFGSGDRMNMLVSSLQKLAIPPVDVDKVISVDEFEHNNGKAVLYDQIQKRFSYSRLIQKYENFPKLGVTFKNVFPLFRDPEAHTYIVTNLTKLCYDANIKMIFGVASRGYLAATTVAHLLNIPFVPITKPGKLPPAAVWQESYTKEYGQDTLQVEKIQISVEDLARNNCLTTDLVDVDGIADVPVLIFDDLLVTGGSLECSGKLVQKLFAENGIDKSNLRLYCYTITSVNSLFSVAQEKLSETFDQIIVEF